MIAAPQNLTPYDLDLFDDKEHFQTQFRKLFKSITDLGHYTTQCMQRILAEQNAFNAKIDAGHEEEEEDGKPTTFLSKTDVPQQLYNVWCEHFITHMDMFGEVRHYVLDEKQFGTTKEGKKHKFKGTNGSHVFLELTRLNYLVHYPRLLDEMDNLSLYAPEELSSEFYFMLHSLKMTTDQSFIAIVDSFDISALYEEKEDPDEKVEEMRAEVQAMWKKPIMEYTQREVQILIFFLTQQLHDIRMPAIEEYRKVFTILWLRIGQFFMEFQTEDILNDAQMRHGPIDGELYSCAPNQRFIGFCFFYMSELLRRFFYYDLLSKNVMRDVPLRLSFEKTKAWVRRITESMADDAFDAMYSDNMPLAYAFVGDDGWFKFSETGVHSRGACITKLRPHLHKRFFSETQVTPHSVLSTTSDSYVSRLFVLRAIHEHLKIHVPMCRFLNGAVVMNNGIEQSAYMLEVNKAPLLVQVFSSFWPYDQGRVYMCDDIYEAVAMWFWLLHTRYNNHLYECDLTEFVDRALEERGEEDAPSRNDPGFTFEAFEF